MQRKRLHKAASSLAMFVLVVVAAVMPATAASATVPNQTVAPKASVVVQGSTASMVQLAAIPSWVPSKCRTYNGKNGKVICVGIKSWQLVALQNHKVYLITSARHGAEAGHYASDGSGPWPTRRGTFRIYAKYVDKVSTLYRVHMPYFMPFSGGQGIHYSSEYAGGYRWSHGCVGLKSLTKARQLYNWAQVGTTVIVVNA